MEIIAEVGSTWWRPDPDDAFRAARESIAVAKDCGADWVKFQLFLADKLYNKTAARKQWERAKQYELPVEWVPRLSDLCRGLGVGFGLSVFSADVAFAVAGHVGFLKISSGDITNLSLIKKVSTLCATYGIPLFMSMGGTTLEELTKAVNALDPMKVELILFHCVSCYPARAEDYNLSVIKRVTVPRAMGLSDHTIGTELVAPAIAFDYDFFEKHFMLASTPPDCPDYSVSAKGSAFTALCKQAKQVQEICGDGEIKPVSCELEEIPWMRRGNDGLRPMDEVR